MMEMVATVGWSHPAWAVGGGLVDGRGVEVEGEAAVPLDRGGDKERK